MSKYSLFKVRIELGNDAFFAEHGQYDPTETARLLRHAAKQLESGASSGILRDINGNKVGIFAHIK